MADPRSRNPVYHDEEVQMRSYHEQQLHHAQYSGTFDSNMHPRAVPMNEYNPGKVFDDMASERKSEASDLEHAFFEKYERKNWTLSLFPEARRWGIRINPVSFGASVVFIWGFAVWCMLSPQAANDKLSEVQEWITFTMTWAYMLTQHCWVVFLLVLYCSRLGSMKLGRPDDQPEFPTASWFMMMFSAGIGIGLFFFGVAEPIAHYEPCAGNPFAGPGSECYGNRYSQLSADERAQWAMNLTFFHWGLHAWVAYCIVGLLLATVVYRMDLPMTMKSAFYPLLGDKIFGWMGDTIDVIAVATTLFGICTSLGLGVAQLNAGFARLNPDIKISNLNQFVIIWSITALATISVVSGVKVGIRRISEINFLMGQFLLLVVFFQEDTWYLLNNFTQSVGFYLQYFIQLGAHCDTFQMAPAETISAETLAFSEGAQHIHVTAVAPDGRASTRTWMNGNTLFYFGWWIAWAAFVGMFIAKISRGRTVRQVINGSMTGPVLYSFIWFAIYGGTGLRIERQAANLGINCITTMDADGNEEKTYSYTTDDGATIPLTSPMMEFDGREWWRLSCRTSTDMWFDVYANFSMTKFYWGLSLASLILYFVTSSDSGSLVIDCLTANGNPHPPVFQRIFWSITEGLVATALILAGGSKGLQALQAVSLIAGVPFTVIICFMCKALWDVLSDEYKRTYHIKQHVYAEWKTGVLDVLDYPTFSQDQALKTLAAVVAPFWYAAHGAAWADGVRPLYYVLVYGVLFTMWVLLLLLNLVRPGLWAIAWTLYLAFSLHMSYERGNMRSLRNIKGSIAADLFLSICLYPFVAVQLYEEALAAEQETEHTRPSQHHAPQ